MTLFDVHVDYLFHNRNERLTLIETSFNYDLTVKWSSLRVMNDRLLINGGFIFDYEEKFLERGIIVRVQLKVNGVLWGSRDLKCQSKLGEISVLLTKAQLIGNPTDLMCQVRGHIH